MKKLGLPFCILDLSDRAAVQCQLSFWMMPCCLPNSSAPWMGRERGVPSQINFYN